MRVFKPPNIYGITGNEKEDCCTTLHYRNVQCLTDNEGQICGTFPQFPQTFTLRELFNNIVDMYHDRPLIGTKPTDDREDYEWMTYGDFDSLVKKLSASLIQRNFNETTITGVFIENSEWFAVVQWALAYIGSIFFPIDVDFPLPITYSIIETYKCSVVFCTAYTFQKLFDLLLQEQPDTLKEIIVACDEQEFSQLQSDFQSELNSIGSIPIIPIYTLFMSKVKDLSNLPAQYANSTCVYNVTSGRGGRITACILTHSNLIAAAAGLASCGYDFSTAIYYSSISMVKPVERAVELAIMASGGCIGFSHSPAVEALSQIRPTLAAFTPQTLNDVAESLILSAHKSNAFKRFFLDFGFSIIAQCLESGSEVPWSLRELIVRPFQEKAGGRLRTVISTGDYLEPSTLHLVRVMLSVPVIQIYGCAETAGVISVSSLTDSDCMSIGAPTLCCEVKLKDFNDANYIVSRMDPGQIFVRGPNVFAGYFRNSSLTAERLKDGWFATGDLGKMRTNGTLEIVEPIADWRRRKQRK
ncbi:AMP-binding enzyme family protein [Trichomonas vaginalis G3]|uniref:AMP-binding enzyme family protein n=1 Tax=Trichomonas vaginalis (strain ATCC PRA-98 / G3) TaxID=412133 RepID=A2DBI5_TRIV3|nr:decanoate-CoA ligase protein [Trichomonas vaginalis G3]EAY22188.1 AMP-binding enzyme family protein [Trichomonas vaginalis G3]KAI5533354.1 decanoate-CoA ligase protein [Trichomonas vaginalis G3]|eukprot:XP_001583174.1 AMP-binding enzyme family protein [Trichomonas vaginalis G3]